MAKTARNTAMAMMAAAILAVPRASAAADAPVAEAASTFLTCGQRPLRSSR